APDPARRRRLRPGGRRRGLGPVPSRRELAQVDDPTRLGRGLREPL
ncbi:MAG: hypothetical protein AVDCRST_MAG49-2598, partial [uncultured Thermomicrobiales bacterium]